MQSAFDLFAEGFARWWPAEFSWSGTVGLQTIGIEPRVDVRFEGRADNTTRVVLNHGCFERHGDAGERYRSDLEQAWPYALERLRAAAS